MDREAVARELLSAARELNAASEVSLDDLIAADPWVSDLLRKLALISPTFRHIASVWSGVHGNILDFKSSPQGVHLDVGEMKKLSNLTGVRWFRFGKRSSVGIEGSWIGEEALRMAGKGIGGCARVSHIRIHCQDSSGV